MKDIKLVIHCADIHIRNVQRHEEYAQQLERFVEKCKEIAAPYEKVSTIICNVYYKIKKVLYSNFNNCLF